MKNKFIVSLLPRVKVLFDWPFCLVYECGEPVIEICGLQLALVCGVRVLGFRGGGFWWISAVPLGTSVSNN